MKTINILIITYKQQELIKRALDSILCQKEFGLNQIIVSDDCSPDNTWRVLTDYKEKYPDILRIYKNAKNLGIYANVNQVVSHKGEADIYYIMAGDDSLCDGVFEQIQSLIEKNHIECTKPAALYFDWKHVKPNGEERIIRNNYIRKCQDAFGLKLRNRISARSCFATKGAMDKYPVIDLSYGISLAESIMDFQWSLLSEKNYYKSYVGSVYYSGVGVSTNLFNKQYYEESIISCQRLAEMFSFKGRDKYWNLYCIYYNSVGCSPTFKNVFLALWYYFLGVKYGPLWKIRSEMADLLLLLRK